MTSFALLRMLFIRPTHSIWFWLSALRNASASANLLYQPKKSSLPVGHIQR